MANTLANLARMYTETTGTGTLTLLNAVPGFNTFEDEGVPDGSTITYAIYCGPHREIGAGVWTESTKTLTRATVYSSTNGGSRINLTGRSEVFITVAKEDFATFGGGAGLSDGDYGDIVVSGGGTVLNIDSAVATTFGRSLMDDANAAAGRTTLGLGTMATETATNYLTTAAAASGYQPLDSELSAIAGLTSAADRLPYFTGSGTAALATFTAAGRNLVDDATTADQRTTLGLGTAATQNTGTSGANVPLMSTGNTWSAANTFTTANSFGAPVTLQSTNSDANEGPFLLFRRASASPANGDRIGSFLWQMYTSDSPATFATTAAMTCFVPVEVTSSGTSQLVFGTRYAGAYGDRLFISGGVYTAGATGSDKGADTINTNTLYEAGVSLAAKYQPLDADLTTIAGLADPNADRILFWDDSAGAYAYLTAGTGLTITGTTITASGATVADGDYGDVTVSSSGTVWTIDNDAVTYAKLQNTGAGNVVLTRANSAAGDIGETALAASQLLGRGSTGDVAAITIGSGLSMSGTTLSASGSGGLSRGQVVALASLTALT